MFNKNKINKHVFQSLHALRNKSKVILSASLRMRSISPIGGETEAWRGQQKHFLRVCLTAFGKAEMFELPLHFCCAFTTGQTW